MHVTLVQVHVKPEFLEPFLAITQSNHEGAREEPGNLRFDVLQGEDDPTRFLFVEVYRDAQAAAAHKETLHYMAWRDTVKDWMASPREGKRYRWIAPADPAGR